MKIFFLALTAFTINAAAFAGTSAFNCTCLAPNGTYDTSGTPNYKVLGTMQLQSRDSDEAEYFARKNCIAKYRNTEAFSMCQFADVL
ncbi:MAG: hypothetical protein ACXVB9_09455 [Bdellovibrionota bacterium]